MTRILKYQIPVDDQWHEHHAGFREDYFAHVGHQVEGFVTLWTVQPDYPECFPAWLRVVGTGQEFPNNAAYIGTAFDPRGLVWHLIQRTTPPATTNTPTEKEV